MALCVYLVSVSAVHYSDLHIIFMSFDRFHRRNGLTCTSFSCNAFFFVEYSERLSVSANIVFCFFEFIFSILK